MGAPSLASHHLFLTNNKHQIMSEIRQRQPLAAAEPKTGTETAPQREPQRRTDDENDHRISLLDILRVIASVIVFSCSLSYYMTNGESYLWGYRPWFTRWPVMKAYLVRSLESRKTTTYTLDRTC